MILNQSNKKIYYYDASQTKGKTKWNQLNQIKKTKINLKQILNQCARNKSLELFRVK